MKWWFPFTVPPCEPRRRRGWCSPTSRPSSPHPQFQLGMRWWSLRVAGRGRRPWPGCARAWSRCPAGRRTGRSRWWWCAGRTRLVWSPPVGCFMTTGTCPLSGWWSWLTRPADCPVSWPAGSGCSTGSQGRSGGCPGWRSGAAADRRPDCPRPGWSASSSSSPPLSGRRRGRDPERHRPGRRVGRGGVHSGPADPADRAVSCVSGRAAGPATAQDPAPGFADQRRSDSPSTIRSTDRR